MPTNWEFANVRMVASQVARLTARFLAIIPESLRLDDPRFVQHLHEDLCKKFSELENLLESYEQDLIRICATELSPVAVNGYQYSTAHKAACEVCTKAIRITWFAGRLGRQ
jgi:hypothetical protein